jgi:hypothetical protein
MDQPLNPENFIIGDDGGEVTFNGRNPTALDTNRQFYHVSVDNESHILRCTAG